MEPEEQGEARDLGLELLNSMRRLGYTPAMIEWIGRFLVVSSGEKE